MMHNWINWPATSENIHFNFQAKVWIRQSGEATKQRDSFEKRSFVLQAFMIMKEVDRKDWYLSPGSTLLLNTGHFEDLLAL